ncbi:DUF423 domain-containing protein [Ancylobacter oerskovii]|uniref:DUF423 domain-containing protein n=1 Tax=Ancylobacter oerskovii TaxID=459519 RepID=A0ABW4YRI7_9HYPH|nr:DUF423 domain-containing protein [Ancylobacter oerskovii]MBS7545617.1 DUF423 domain-containing protein [Ancylobacter oerskovii]
MTPYRRLIVLLSGIFGVAGVGLAAAAAHAVPDPSLATAASFLMIGAAALAGCAALAVAGGRRRSFADLGAGLIALGTLLFSGAIAVRVLLDAVLFPMAAPTGGTMLMVGWAALGLAAFERAQARA